MSCGIPGKGCTPSTISFITSQFAAGTVDSTERFLRCTVTALHPAACNAWMKAMVSAIVSRMRILAMTGMVK